MAHAKINLQRMYDWIEWCLDEAQSMPTDAAIMQRFGFDNAESARTLLAELADAGRITIKGYGETRTIALGRIKSALVPARRPTPSAKRSDPVVDAGIAKIAAIVARGGNANAARANQAAEALKAIGTKRPPVAVPEKTKLVVTPAPAPPQKEAPSMPAKSVQLPASAVVAITAIEAHARKNDVSMGVAAAHLIEAGLTAPAGARPAPILDTKSVDDLLALIKARFEGLLNLPDRSDEVAALTIRAETAERKLEALRAALA